MIELEVYAAGVRSLEKILELDRELETVPGLRYKIDSNHDIVYLEFDEPTLTVQEVRSIFRKLSLEARIVGSIPAELNPKSKTQPIRMAD
jgi:Zn-dependent M32 family carboxypeptidase